MDGINWWVVGCAVVVAVVIGLIVNEIVALRASRKERERIVFAAMHDVDDEYKRLLESA